MSKNHREYNFKYVSYEINAQKEMSVIVRVGTKSSIHLIDPLECMDISKDGSAKEGYFRFNAEALVGGQITSLPRKVAHLKEIVFKSIKKTPVRGTLLNKPAGWELKKN